jgi:uncharacterized sulfatase
MDISRFIKRLDEALQSLLAPLPGLTLALLVLRLSEVGDTGQSFQEGVLLLARMAAQDVTSVLRGLVFWCLLTAPCLAIRSPSLRWTVWGAGGSLVLLTEALLAHYFSVSGALLGADLLAYSASEILTTVKAAEVAAASTWVLSLLASLMVYAASLWLLARRTKRSWPQPVALLCLGLGTGLLMGLPSTWPPAGSDGERNKLAAFSQDLFEKRLESLSGDQVVSTAVDSAYPFARQEKTPDTLSPLFQWRQDAKPNFIFIIVEGLGRSFSGPGARLGSFTPFLDALSERSLYWENFLATQGRTFAVLPSVFGSLPQGFYAHPQITHDSLLSVLKEQGYVLRYFTGTNLEFDHQGEYLSTSGVTDQFSERDYAPPARRLSDWGYADGDLLAAVSDRLSSDKQWPHATVVQTMSMHTPFVFPEMEVYRKRVVTRLDQLGIPMKDRAPYQRQLDIYASIMYTDEMIRQFFQRLAKTPAAANTVVFITGDHRLPEIPMATRLERYHVPLIVTSPLLRAPQKIRAVASHFDIAPSLLAMLSNQYGMPTPATVSWMGAGLDVSTSFRSLRAFPMQQTKTELSDFVSGPYYLGKDQLYRFTQDMQPEPVNQPDVLASLQAALEAFKKTNASLSTVQSMVPEHSRARRTVYDSTQRVLDIRATRHEQQGLVVSVASAQLQGADKLVAQALFTNHSTKASPVFVPLLVVTDDQGQQVAEHSGKALRLAPGESVDVKLDLPMPSGTGGLGERFVALIASDPDNGKSIGQGQYRVAVQK